MTAKKTKKYTIAVVATMSAGKSTLLNAMIGQHLLPSRNEACTATTCRIEDDDSLSAFHGRPKVNGNWQDWETPITREDVDAWNASRVDEIELRGNLPWVDNTRDGYRIVLIDTPGPNNSTNLDHAQITENILKTSDFASLVFVVNAETPGVDDEWTFLNKICATLKARDRHARIVFVLNKIDKIDPEKDETIVGVAQNRLRQFSSIGFNNPVMVPVFGDLAVRLREAMRTKKPYRLTKNGARSRVRKYGRLYEAIGSKRFLQSLKTDIGLVLRAKSFYRDGFKLTKEVWQALRYCDHRRLSASEKLDMLLVGGKFFKFSDIRTVEKLCGIPILEALLEVHLKEFANSARKEL